jgi:hypothetical protein
MKNDIEFLSLLKSKAIRFEDHSWTNSRGTQFQSALIFKSEDRQEIFLIIENLLCNENFEVNKNFSFILKEKENKKHFYYYGEKIFQRITLSKKKAYKSYIARLDSPVRERINYLKAELRKAREGKTVGRPPLLIEELLKQAKQKTLREHIEDSLEKDLEKNLLFRNKLKESSECLVTNFLTAPYSLWMNTKDENNKTIQKRLGMGISILFSNEQYLNKSYEVARKVTTALEKGWILGDYVLF